MLSIHPHRPQSGGALVIVIILLFVMSVSLLAIHNYTDGVGRMTGRDDQYLCANAAAHAAMDVVVGRLIQWVNSNSGYGPNITDCATAGVPGNTAFPAITGTITFPSGTVLGNYTVSTPVVDPVLPDDTIVTSTSAADYLTPVAQRVNVSDNSPTCVDRYYFTRSAALNTTDVMSRSMTYKISLTVTPKVQTLQSSSPVTLTRYFRIDKVNPFDWCTYRNGTESYYNTNTYSGPMYIAGSVTLGAPTTIAGDVLYGATADNAGATFTGGGFGAQVTQTSLLPLIPNLSNIMAVNASGQRLASYETNTTITNGVDPADEFSVREVIEPPNYPSNDVTPTAFKNARIYNQADVRIQVYVTKSGNTSTVTKQVVGVNGSPLSTVGNPWIAPLLAAVNVNTSGQFYDRSRSTTQPIQSTDINVGALGSVMEAYPSVFPTGIIYVWDSSTAATDGGVTPLTGVRVWNAGVLPTGGLELGTTDPIYMKGDFNTGATLPANATINTPPSTLPYSSNGMAVNSNPTTEAQRTVPGYTIQPAGLFGDSVTELSNGWTDTNSLNTETARSTTYNLVEGWSSMMADELNADDTYTDGGRGAPIWIENWSGARRTMSGEEFVVWHSIYGQNTNEGIGGGWLGDVSYDPKATSLKLNWGETVFDRDRLTSQ